MLYLKNFYFMKRLLSIFALAASVNLMSGNDATFTYFSYEGKEPRYEKAINPSNEYFNPIIAGYYPDPSVCKKGETYYLVNSSFAYFPGVPIFESKDLVNWKQIGHVLDRESQLDVKGKGVSDGIFAPAISYNKHNDTFYMISTVMGGKGNFYVKSKDPHKGWSDPIWLPEVTGIDPSFHFDDDGKAYIVHNSDVMGKERYPGERAIRLLHFDAKKDKTIGEPIEILRSGTHVRENPVWIEGPHLYHIGEWYYLMCAEGGTDEQHSEVILRAKDPEGPWEECPMNPILTQREGLPYDREEKVTSTGHADIIQDNDGKWWGVFLGCLPYEGNLYNTGRNTYLLPVEWKDGWPIILEKNEAVPTVVRKEGLQPAEGRLTGNFSFTDNFNSPVLNHDWVSLRNPAPDSHRITEDGLVIKASKGNIYQREPLSTVFRRQQHTNFTAETELDFTPESEADLAGIVLVQNENFNFIFGKTIVEGEEALVLKRRQGAEEVLAVSPVNPGKLKLKVDGEGRYYSFYYMDPATQKWMPIAGHVDASNLSTDKAGGFVGAMIGLYATEAN